MGMTYQYDKISSWNTTLNLLNFRYMYYKAVEDQRGNINFNEHNLQFGEKQFDLSTPINFHQLLSHWLFAVNLFLYLTEISIVCTTDYAFRDLLTGYLLHMTGRPILRELWLLTSIESPNSRIEALTAKRANSPGVAKSVFSDPMFFQPCFILLASPQVIATAITLRTGLWTQHGTRKNGFCLPWQVGPSGSQRHNWPVKFPNFMSCPSCLSQCISSFFL